MVTDAAYATVTPVFCVLEFTAAGWRCYGVSGFGSVTEDDVEFGGELAELGIFEGGEIDGDGVAGFGVFDSAVDAVALVAGMTFDVALRRELFFALHFHLEVNVGRTAGIGDGLDGAEEIF